jgi:hypothetical protein
MRYVVAEYAAGKMLHVISGMGRNRQTWSADHSRSAAYGYARELRRDKHGRTFRVLTCN